MTDVELRVAGRRHRLRARPDEREALIAAAAEVDRRARRIAGAVGPVDEARLLLMVALELADELKAQVSAATAPDAAMVERLERLADGLERIARLAPGSCAS